MQRMQQIELRTYRNCRLEVLDDGSDGWVVAIHKPGEAKPILLKNNVPNGLGELLELAQEHVDRLLGFTQISDYP